MAADQQPAKKAKTDSFADTQPLSGKVALITGSSQGVGSGIALELAKAGAHIVVNYVGDGDADAEEVAKQIRETGQKALIVKASVADRAESEAMFNRIEKELGALDILVTSAMAAKRQSILDTKLEDFKNTIDVGVIGVFNCMQLAARQMLAAGKKGSIVHITSPHQNWPAKDAIDYNTAKAAQHHLVLSVANELMWKGIRVNFVEPGWTITKNEIKLFGMKQLQENGNKMPFGRLAEPADSARAVLWLCSEEARFVVGTTIKCDSGMFIEGGQSWNQAPRERASQ